LKRTRKAADKVMSLIIVWRNPRPPARAERKVQRVVEDQFGTVYQVTDSDVTQGTFELYPGGGMKGAELRRGVAEAGSTFGGSTAKEENRDDTVRRYAVGKQSQAADPCA
jgi:hypothetical protein